MKSKAPKPKEVRTIRLSDSMWQNIRAAAASKDMRPSEFIRRILETHLSDAEQYRQHLKGPGIPRER